MVLTKTTWNDLQRTRKDLKQPTTSKTQPTTTRTYLQRLKKDAKRPTTSRFWDYFTIWSNQFSSLTHFQPIIWLQSFQHCLMENHGENRAPNISILSCIFNTNIKFTGYVVNHFEIRKLTFAKQKSTLWIKQKKSNFDTDKTIRTLKMITWSFSAHHTEKRRSANYALFFKLNWKVFRFLRLKFAPKASHVAYIEPRWYGSRISAHCQQSLISPKHGSNGRFLLVIFLKEQKREDDT